MTFSIFSNAIICNAMDNTCEEKKKSSKSLKKAEKLDDSEDALLISDESDEGMYLVTKPFEEAFLTHAKELKNEFNNTGIDPDALPKSGSYKRVLIALSSLLMEKTECAAVFMHPQKEELWIAFNKSSKKHTQVKKIIKSLGEIIQNPIADLHRPELIHNETIRELLISSASARASADQADAKKVENSNSIVHWIKKIINLRVHLNEKSEFGFIGRCLVNHKKKIKYLEANGVHAEMNLLDQLHKNNLLQTGGFIGISKQCCLFCAAALQAVNNAFPGTHYRTTGSHGNIYPWSIPLFIKENEDFLKIFLGEKAYKICNKYLGLKDEYLKAIENQVTQINRRQTRQDATENTSDTILVMTSDEEAPSINRGEKKINVKAVEGEGKKDKKAKPKTNKSGKNKEPKRQSKRNGKGSKSRK